MINKRIVIALGGNALGNSAKEQLELVVKTAISIVDLIVDGYEVVVAHGNGPQVGMINLAMETNAKVNGIDSMPFPECGAMSQGYIGYHLQKAIQTELKNREIKKSVATVISQVIVDPNDDAFKNPTKPIGAFYDQETSIRLTKTKGYIMVEDSGRGYRRVVPSPLPIEIEEIDIIKQLVSSGNVVIAVGGGGVPVVREGNNLIGVPAVIDKDFASALLAKEVDADYLVVLTAVEKVAINFGKENQQWLDSISVDEAKEFIKQNHFAPGSMLPKVKACMLFAKSQKGSTALITSLEKASEGIKGLTGTIISAR